MSNITMPLRDYIEHYSQYEDGLNLNEKIEKARPYLFDFDYPIFDEDYKPVFETHFIRNFYMRNIGFETEEYFKMRLENWLTINMPYFNKLFESELIEFDPLTNTKFDITHNKKNETNQNDDRNISQSSSTEGTSDSSSNQTDEYGEDKTENNTIEDDNFDRHISSDQPDGRLGLTSNDGDGVIEYASEIEENTLNNKRDTNGNSNLTGDRSSNASSNQSTNTSSSASQDDALVRTINDLEDYVEARTGKIGSESFSKLLQEYRQSFLRIEKDIFDEMQVLFMMVYH